MPLSGVAAGIFLFILSAAVSMAIAHGWVWYQKHRWATLGRATTSAAVRYKRHAACVETTGAP